MKVTEDLEKLRAAKPHLFGLASQDGLHLVELEKTKVRFAYDAEMRALQQLLQSYRASRRWEQKNNPESGTTSAGERIVAPEDMSTAQFNRILKSTRGE